jgi:hypothetical protein
MIHLSPAGGGNEEFRQDSPGPGLAPGAGAGWLHAFRNRALSGSAVGLIRCSTQLILQLDQYFQVLLLFLF